MLVDSFTVVDLAAVPRSSADETMADTIAAKLSRLQLDVRGCPELDSRDAVDLVVQLAAVRRNLQELAAIHHRVQAAVTAPGL